MYYRSKFVLFLGKETGEELKLLNEFRNVLKEYNFHGILIKEHEEARVINNQIRRAAESGKLLEAATAAAKYRKLLLEHIHNENEELFPAIDKRIKREQEETIFEHFKAVEKRTLGENGATRIDEIIKKWENELLS